MSTDELLNDEFAVLQEETLQAAEQVAAYQRKLMTPIWHKRREIVKKIPGFWAQSMGNSPLFALDPSEHDIEALEHLTDFHVEYDHDKPNYRKIVATFKKNDMFKNETLTKEFSVDPEDEDNEDEEAISLLDWFGNDDVRLGLMLSEDFFPQALEYYQDEESGDEAEEIELGSDESDESDDEEVAHKHKKAKK
ncbi:uncharacterized protein B0P05DRAFT_479433 [Gilbertella persicaria]|uniref:uncharacterized protein n=1 Tax=Gilbertella persicaria TaxID=101096 RepID=UPI00221F9D0B|nr:uncharacterized protein B0P05DRAFT_479433 [Gilbertella persicaria]KAI8054973.1 hypothetical protein B0P05DRAFT_479433 [Gilbertella persicaria]